ncbi:MAG TPA: SpoIIE family protein phosphatase, partial [Bacteroidia bacterium]
MKTATMINSLIKTNTYFRWMKLKITNPWIPITLVLVLVLAIVLGLGSSSPDFIALPLGIASACGLLFIYFPLLIFTIIRKNHPKKDKIINTIGLLCTGVILLYLLWKAMHWPGAGPMLVLAMLVFVIYYFPAWFFAAYSKANRLQNILNFLVCTFLALLLLYTSFKAMHWIGASIIGTISIWTLLGLLIPFVLYCLLFKRTKIKFEIKNQSIFVFILGIAISGIQTRSVMNDVMNSNMMVGEEKAEQTLTLYTNKNKFVYDAFLSSKEKDTAFLALQKKAIQLQKVSLDMHNYMEVLKHELIAKTDRNPGGDTLHIRYVDAKGNYDMPTMMLIGADEMHPKSGRFTATELKTKLNKFTEQVTLLVPEEVRTQFKQNNPINTLDVTDEGDKVSWEVYSFSHLPLIQVVTTLTSFQADVKYAEMIALNELFNKANTNRKDNVAAQLAELATKYETVKKDKEISLLEKDKELNDTKLKAKDDEKSQLERTITYFILALIGFTVLIVFVIRSNLLRRQANKLLLEQKDIISQQKFLVEEKNHEIIDSITYAKRLQQAILPTVEAVQEQLPNSFIYYQPKDIVAGDFYWMHTTKEAVYIAAADCTGHGVPGAMVSVVCSNALNRAVKEFNLTDTGLILDKTRELVIETFEKSDKDVKDGMDISLLRINTTTKEIQWSGANNSLWYILNKELVEVKADKQPIGKYSEAMSFTTNSLSFHSPITFYLFSDGYADQFSPDDKKLMKKKFKDIVLSIQNLSMQEQKNHLDKFHTDWKG